MKVCTNCKDKKNYSEFNKNKRNKDGRATECRECTKLYGKKYRKEHKHKLLEASRQFKEEHREEINAKNRDKCKTKRLNQEFIDKKREASKKYKCNNKGKVNADTAKRYSRKLQRSALTTDREFKHIETLYKKTQELTQETGIPHHVDHIVPLKGERVSGLHVLSNLQILTEQENCSKHNTFVV